MSNGNICFNGIDGVSGRYLMPPLSEDALAAVVSGAPPKQDEIQRAQLLERKKTDPHLGLPFNVKPEDLTKSGWGIVFHKDEDPAVRQKFEPLLEHRRRTIGNDKIVKVLRDYRTGRSVAQWLAEHGIGQGSVLPDKVPYYVLVVGGPDKIPFEFCHQLDVEYAVGRLHFDTPEEYAAYVSSVIAYETGAAVPNSRRMVYWAPRHALDGATQLSADRLVAPLAKGAPGENAIAAECGFTSQDFIAGDATKQALLDAFLGANGGPPALLFTASHGMGWPLNHASQRDATGALLCQDWPALKPTQPAHYFAAADLVAGAKVHGLVGFHFACFSAGIPERDSFSFKPGEQPPVIAPGPFFSRLPQRLLCHPGGGALAFIGHIERAWGYSIVSPDAGAQRQPFRNLIGRILSGEPVGHAVKDFNERYSSLSVTLSQLLIRKLRNEAVPLQALNSSFVERNDAGAYVVFGDPAARVRVDKLN
jgi:hypothetical protein